MGRVFGPMAQAVVAAAAAEPAMNWRRVVDLFFTGDLLLCVP